MKKSDHTVITTDLVNLGEAFGEQYDNIGIRSNDLGWGVFDSCA